MKAVLISIQPQHCVNITSGRKRIEVRKKRTTCKVPFKAFIYCTKDKWEHFVQMPDKTYRIYNGREYGAYDKSLKFEGESNGKIIGEFVCDRIDEYVNHFMAWRDKNGKQFNVGEFLSNACVTLDEVSNYIAGSIKFYGWHISELKIYDKPKELSEFRKPCDRFLDCFLCRRYKRDEFGGCDSKIRRPPQSWCYVEEIQE